MTHLVPAWLSALLPSVLYASAVGSLAVLGVWLAATALRRSSAAVRHQLWAGAAILLLALPGFAAVTPWRVSVLPAAVVRLASGAAPGAPVPPGPAAVAPTAAAAAPAAATQSERLTAGAPRPLPWRTLAAGAWALGALLVLAWLGAGSIAAGRIRRRARPLDDTASRQILDDVTAALRLRRRPELLQSIETSVPFTLGIMSPAVILPTGSDQWPPAQLRAVLAHELEHLRRRDPLLHLLGWIACAVHWFNPLAWIAARRLRAESERACDDAVLRLGTRASDYAEHLLEIVRSAGHWRVPAAAVTAARASEFEGRVLAVLEQGRRRGAAPILSGLVVLVACLAAIPLAAIAPGTASPAAPAPPAPAGAAADNMIADTLADGTVAALARTLADDPSPAVRNRAAWALGNLRRADGVAALTSALRSDRNTAVRDRAAWALGIIRSPAGVPGLVAALLDDAEESIRDRAGWALGVIRHPAAADGLAAALDDPASTVRRRAVWALAEIARAGDGRDGSAAALRAALQNDDPAVREAAVQALAALPR